MLRMELRQFRYFVAVAEELHFRRAGERLHVAQPALSLQIKQLEEELGVRLLERNQRKVELTVAGAAFLERARTLLRDAEFAAAEARRTAAGEGGSFALGFVSTASFALLPTLLRRLRQAMPKLEVHLHEWQPTVQLEALAAGTLDLGLLQAAEVPPALASHLLGRERLVVALPRRHRLAARAALRPKDLADETLFLPTRELAPTLHDAILRTFATEHTTPRRLQPVEQVQTALSLAAEGLGVSLVPAAAEHGIRPGLALRPLQAAELEVAVRAVWRLEKPVSATLRRVLAVVKTLKA
ncbi:LysR family transcriptional regulator [Granulicella cerasi]|uniref:LysR family transcriptional regulator n=1 Tax=Granulicella cerasi TaxID=741063 RepID=A0ABW1Z9D2_9BACT|nr:LysR substrate-binding domain-containing protein [Granulicella cerasi]